MRNSWTEKLGDYISFTSKPVVYKCPRIFLFKSEIRCIERRRRGMLVGINKKYCFFMLKKFEDIVVRIPKDKVVCKT